MAPPRFDENLGFLEGVEDLPVQELGLKVADAPIWRLVEDGVLAVQWCMGEALVIQSLKNKRAEIHGRIAAYEAQIAQARHDLAHVSATIRLFTEPEHQRARYMVSHGFFKKGEIADVCVRHLGVDGEMTTRQLAERVMAERKLDASDRTLRNSVVFKVAQALRPRQAAQAGPDGREAQGYVRLGVASHLTLKLSSL